ncbi:MAG: terminase family protein [Methyloligellaceae bacterium]
MRECSRANRTEECLARLGRHEIERLRHDWELWAREDQLPPLGDWSTWLILAGRGAGKTRAGAEWVRRLALAGEEGLSPCDIRIALVGETLGDVRSVMVEGVSGVLGVHAAHERPLFEPSKKQLIWQSGALAQLFSADDPESLRGPQFTHAWCDELAKWRHARASWDMLQFALRLGDRPRQVVTTTPRPLPLLKEIMADPATRITRAVTADNAANLAPAFLESIVARYKGTRLGRQELEAEMLEDPPDALWPRALIERCRVQAPPPLARIVVAVDPPVSATRRSDACGIIVAGREREARACVLHDATVTQASPSAWAGAAVAAYRRFGADRIVAEVNQGGDLVESVIRQVDPAVAVRKVRATRGKWLRAEPVAALYEQGRVVHAGAFPALEDQMAEFGRNGLSGGGSPDRLDALVWALTDLMLREDVSPRIRTL